MILCINAGALLGKSNVVTLFLLHKPLCWSGVHIQVFTCCQFLVNWGAILVFIKILHKYLADYTIVIAGTVSAISSSIILAISTEEWIVYLYAVIGIMAVSISPLLRSVLSRLVSPVEQDSTCVLDDHSFNVSDHYPVIAKLTLDNTVIDDTETLIKQCKISWNKAREKNNLEDFCFATSQYLWDVEIPSLGCSNRDIKCYHSNIVDAIQQAETETLPHKTFLKYLKQYWTQPVNALHKHMASKRQLRISNNRPRVYTLYFKSTNLPREISVVNYEMHIKNICKRHMIHSKKDFDIGNF
ncbi:Hypothetical predicted protein [Mytilus galloprovincialis]|uniref:Uncharacterized protein n=1 Tax=Mytilus galloprovincialis TaxID=29158 RepID=A0A8B6DXP5_MYTGA|nr:Hypothetical predicted protein [Mytilus galloprovincialis]